MAHSQAPAGLGCRPESEEVRPRPYAARKGLFKSFFVCPLVPRSKPIPILGTNVRLDTPEEIAAWIAERKRRWPTESRVAEKKRKLEQAMANGELHPDHLALMGGKRFRPLSSDTDVTRTSRGRGGPPFGFGGTRGRGRGRGRGAYGQNRVPERSAARDGITSSASTLPSSRSPTVKDTELPSLPSAQSARDAAADAASHLDSDDNDGDDDDDDAAPEVMSAKRPPGIVAYGSSSDTELEKPDAVNDQPGPTIITPSSRSGPDAISTSQQSSLPKAESANRPRRAPPPQPKKPPRNPFAVRPSLLRNVSASIIATLFARLSLLTVLTVHVHTPVFLAFAARDSRDCVQSLPSHPFPGRE